MNEWDCRQPKAPEDRRSPKPDGMSRALIVAARFWTAPVLWRFGRQTIKTVMLLNAVTIITFGALPGWRRHLFVDQMLHN